MSVLLSLWSQYAASLPGWRHLLTVLFLAGLFAAILYRTFIALYLSPLRHIPGPYWARILWARTEMYVAVGKMSYLGRREYSKYGDICVCAPTAICISDPADIHTVFNHPAVTKAHYYRLLSFNGMDNTASAQDISLANSRRRQIGPYFHPIYISKMEQVIMERGILSMKQKWDGLIKQSADGIAEVNFGDDLLFCSFDTIGTLVFGRQIKELQVNDAATARWIDEAVASIGIRAMLQLLPKFPLSLIPWPWDRRYNTLSTYIHESINSRRKYLDDIAEKGGSEKKPADLLQAFIEAEDPESKVRMSQDQIHSECMLMMIAGADTVAHTITWAIHLLTLYPDQYARAVKEVREQFEPDHLIIYPECRAKLPFIEACLYEALRLTPVTGGLLPRMSPKGGLTIKGHFIPEGIMIFANLAASHRHKETWDEPHVFDPARFLRDSEARHNVLTFSGGKRICPGKHLAWIEMLTMLSNLLKDYDWQLPKDLLTRFGPGILDEHGYPRHMDSKQFIVVKPANPERDCRLVIKKAESKSP